LANAPIISNLLAAPSGHGPPQAAKKEFLVTPSTPGDRIRLLLLDELLLFRHSLGRYLASQPDFEVAGECGESSEGLQVLRTAAVDVVLMELRFGAGNAEEFIAAARDAGYRGQFLVVTGDMGVREAASSIKSGASGIFLKSDASDRLVQAIRLVAAGAVWIDPKLIRLMADRLYDLTPQAEESGAPVLTDRERRVLVGVVEGLTNRKIGAKLGISESAVKAAIQQLFQRAGVRTRSQLVRAAFEGMLGEPGESAPPSNLAIINR
jgi:two-component system, NarL family, nitrate/nitrite response regulator NarL